MRRQIHSLEQIIQKAVHYTSDSFKLIIGKYLLIRALIVVFSIEFSVLIYGFRKGLFSFFFGFRSLYMFYLNFFLLCYRLILFFYVLLFNRRFLFSYFRGRLSSLTCRYILGCICILFLCNLDIFRFLHSDLKCPRLYTDDSQKSVCASFNNLYIHIVTGGPKLNQCLCQSFIIISR